MRPLKERYFTNSYYCSLLYQFDGDSKNENKTNKNNCRKKEVTRKYTYIISFYKEEKHRIRIKRFKFRFNELKTSVGTVICNLLAFSTSVIFQ